MFISLPSLAHSACLHALRCVAIDSSMVLCVCVGSAATTELATWSVPGSGYARGAGRVQQPSFSVNTTLVQVPVVVTDRHGQPIDGLDKEAFQVSDNGRVVDIDSFVHVRVPLPDHDLWQKSKPAIASWSEPAAQRNRVLWIVFDDLHMSAVRVTVAQEIARTLVQRWLGAGDLVGVRQVGGDTDETTLKGDVPAALKAIAAFRVRSQAALLEQEEIERALQLVSTLRAIGQTMGSLTDRRVSILLLSEGIGYDVFNVQASGTPSITQGLQGAMSALRRGNVVLYAIDPRGLTSTEGTAVETGAAGGSVEAALAGAANRVRVGQINLWQMAEETGGFASVNSNSFEPAIDRIGREMSDYYMLGFTPSDGRCEGGARRLTVKVRMPGVRVRARQFYGCEQPKDGGH